MTEPFTIEALGKRITYRDCRICEKTAQMQGIFCEECIAKLVKSGLSSELLANWRPDDDSTIDRLQRAVRYGGRIKAPWKKFK